MKKLTLIPAEIPRKSKYDWAPLIVEFIEMDVPSVRLSDHEEISTRKLIDSLIHTLERYGFKDRVGASTRGDDVYLYRKDL